MRVSIARAAWRPVAYVLVAIPMVLLAVDMMAAHKWFPAPDTTQVSTERVIDDGSTVGTTVTQLTADGRAQHRREIVWGSALLVGGVAAAAWGLKDLLFPRRVLTIDPDYLALRVGSRVSMERLYRWDEVADVRSGVLEDEAGKVPVLSLCFVDQTLLPPDPWGAVVDPPWLHLYANEWDRQAHEVAPMIEAHIAPYRRRGEPG